MRFNKILLISPPSSSRYGGLRVPAGIGYIAQALDDNSIDYEYVDMRIGNSFSTLRKTALAYNPDLVGISMVTLEYKKNYRLISRLKEILPQAMIVVGGHHMTILKETVMEECPAIDFGVVADGEETMLDLCEDKVPYDQIKGLIYRKGEKIIFTGNRPPVKSLDQYAYPKYKKFNMKNYSMQIPVHSSRGCVYKCVFCPNRVLKNFQTRSPENFVDEIEYWYGRGYRQFAVDDDNFTLNKERVYRICDEIEKRGIKDLFIRCSNGIRADRVDKQLLSRMKDIGVREVGFGVDGGNNKTLAALKKGETIETIERGIKDACDLGMDVKIFIIVGTPGETLEDIEDSIRLAGKFPIARVNFNNAIPYPGTEMFDYCKENNLFLVPPEEYLNNISEEKQIPVIQTPQLSKEDRIKILKRCHEVEKEVMKNTVYRMYGSKHPIFGMIIKYFFNVSLFETLFFKNLLLRNILESIRYRKLKEKSDEYRRLDKASGIRGSDASLENVQADT